MSRDPRPSASSRSTLRPFTPFISVSIELLFTVQLFVFGSFLNPGLDDSGSYEPLGEVVWLHSRPVRVVLDREFMQGENFDPGWSWRLKSGFHSANLNVSR
ncbi:hypothetical protein CRM22_002989 [Opisthorchis felineus]|uniref:Uncharacterized protein n=1 Tax=Opisthorchis felineus TaxID=147828 RepID=A0A4S2M820_OPIFE|nr:hypothetical protein CRM22_002989 [Opisthorchis felineus]